MSECSVDWTDMDGVCSDRGGWKKCVSERMKHLDKQRRNTAEGIYGDRMNI